jgi:hypothetical protein
MRLPWVPEIGGVAMHTAKSQASRGRASDQRGRR